MRPARLICRSNNMTETEGPMNRVRIALLLIPALLLAACGGGGGGGGDDSASAQGAQLVITAGNSQAVAAEAVAVSSDTETAAGSALVTGVQVDGGAGGGGPLKLAAAARKLLALAPAPVALASGVTQTSTVACSGGGSLDASVTTSGTSGTIAAGDSYTITANNCTEGVAPDTLRMNGSITISIVSGNYDPASAAYPKSVTMRMVTQNFSVTDGGGTTASSGDVTMTLTENSATDISVALSSSSLSTSIGAHTVVLTNYSLQVTETSAGSVVQMSATVATNNSRLGSTLVSYAVSTPTPITVNASGAITAGAIKVSGSGSSLLLTATGANIFSLQVDSNGDGAYDSTTSVTHSQLQALL
jgi:hypothetical protein